MVGGGERINLGSGRSNSADDCFLPTPLRRRGKCMKIERKKEGKQLKRCQKDREMFQLSSKKGCVKEKKKRKQKLVTKCRFFAARYRTDSQVFYSLRENAFDSGRA